MAHTGILNPKFAGEIHSDDTPIDQRPVPADLAERDGDVIIADPDAANKDYLAALAFNEEPVTIRLEPSTDRNAFPVFEVRCNGIGAEVFRDGRWHSITYLPVGQIIITKRKYLEIIAKTKTDRVETIVREPESDHPRNDVTRVTSAVHSFSVIEDRNPKGAAWLTDLLRRNF